MYTIKTDVQKSGGMTWHLPHFCGFRLTRRDAVTRCRFIRVDIHRGKKKNSGCLFSITEDDDAIMVLPRWTYTTHQPSTTIINIQSNEGKSLSSAAASSHVPDGRTRLCVAVCYYYFQHLYALAAFTSPCLARRKKNPIVLYSIPRIFREKNQRN